MSQDIRTVQQVVVAGAFGGQLVSGLFVGIDVSFAKGKPLPLVVAKDHAGRVTPVARGELPRKPPRGHGNRALATWDPAETEDPAVAFAEATADLLDDTARMLGLRIERIAIDAPRAGAPDGALRASEQAMADAGLNFIQTPHDLDVIRARARASAEAGAPDNRLAEANRLWMIVGCRLFEVLGNRFGHDRVIEVYPYAAFERLSAAAEVKASRLGAQQRLEALTAYAGWESADDLGRAVEDACWGSTHDKIDAFLCAVLAARGRVEDSFQGSDADPFDRIWMPSV